MVHRITINIIFFCSEFVSVSSFFTDSEIMDSSLKLYDINKSEIEPLGYYLIDKGVGVSKIL